MNVQLNKRAADASQRPTISRTIAKQFSHKLPPNVLLYRARRLLGVSRQLMADQMGIPRPLLRKFEFGEVKMPSSFLLKIFMFGLDYWTDGIYWSADDEEKTSKPKN